MTSAFRYGTLIGVCLLVVPLATRSAPKPPRNFHSHLSGGEEVPPVDTRAQGQLHLKVSKDGDSVRYKLIAANIHNATVAHIHVGAPGALGPPVVFLFGPQPTPGRFSGVLAEGTFTSADIEPNAVGVNDLDDLLAVMEAGNTYVNVHTNDGVAPPNTGPGDMVSGEIRGQIR
jgi:hypothetical protein